MVPTTLNKAAMAVLLVVTLVGAADAAIGQVWDQVAVFALAAGVELTLLAGMLTSRPPVPLRGDLVSWLRERSAATGEPLELIADRCIAAARADLDHH